MSVSDSPTTEELWDLCQSQPLRLVANKYELSVQEIVSRFSHEGLYGGTPKDPTPDEILAARNRIKESWDETTQRARWVGNRGRQIR